MFSKDLISLVYEVKRGNEKAWDLLYKELFSFASEVLKRFQLTDDEKKDIIQDALLRLQKSFKNIESITKGQFLQYFKKICINCFYDYKQSFTETYELSFEMPDPENPLNSLESKEIMDKVFEIIKDESLKDKQVFFLKLKGYKEKEIAWMLNIPSGTVASTYSRILDKIRRKILKTES